MRLKTLTVLTLACLVIYSCQKSRIEPNAIPLQTDSTAAKMLSLGFRPYHGAPVHADTLTLAQVVAQKAKHKSFMSETVVLHAQKKTSTDYFNSGAGTTDFGGIGATTNIFFQGFYDTGLPYLFRVSYETGTSINGQIYSASFILAPTGWGYFFSSGNSEPNGIGWRFFTTGSSSHFVFTGGQSYVEQYNVHVDGVSGMNGNDGSASCSFMQIF